MVAGFWEDADQAKKIMQQQNHLKRTIDEFNEAEESLNEVEGFLDLLSHEEDELTLEVDALFERLKKKIERMSLANKLTGLYDDHSAILMIHAGTGGTDAQDWAKILLRMYVRWGEAQGYSVTTLDLQTAQEAGIKSAALLFEGPHAYGYLKSEKGVHRLVRISPFNANGKRQTSFASVDIMPELEDVADIEINPTELKIDTYRSSGAGGQHVNTTDSAVRITHLPTGLVVQCQNQRSQIMNRETAMKMLLGKLVELKEREHKEKISDLAGDYSQIAWGSQIRSYVLHPYQLVKDHRTNYETAAVSAVLDGELSSFIESYLILEQKEQE